MTLECGPCFDRLIPASFRGVGFYVLTDKSDFGRRIHQHEYPMRDIPFQEDLGEKAPRYHVNGYTVGANAWEVKDALVAACRMRGPALLQLPASAPVLVVCNSCSVTRSRDKCGEFEITMEFSDAGTPLTATPVGLFENLIDAVFDSALPVMEDLFFDVFNTVDVLQYVTDAAIERAELFSSEMIGAIESYQMIDVGIASASARLAIDISVNVDSYITPPPTQTGPSIVSSIATIFRKLTTAMYPDSALAVLRQFASASYGEGLVLTIPAGQRSVDGTAYSKSEWQDALNAAAFNDTVRAFALIGMSKVAAAYDYTSRKQAIQMRADLAEMFSSLIDRLMDQDVVLQLVTARDYAVRAITKSMTDIVPVIEIEAPKPMPSLYWAYRLYADPTRATELADRNSVTTPAFMPRRFEALTR